MADIDLTFSLDLSDVSDDWDKEAPELATNSLRQLDVDLIEDLIKRFMVVQSLLESDVLCLRVGIIYEFSVPELALTTANFKAHGFDTTKYKQAELPPIHAIVRNKVQIAEKFRLFREQALKHPEFYHYKEIRFVKADITEVKSTDTNMNAAPDPEADKSSSKKDTEAKNNGTTKPLRNKPKPLRNKPKLIAMHFNFETKRYNAEIAASQGLSPQIKTWLIKNGVPIMVSDGRDIDVILAAFPKGLKECNRIMVQEEKRLCILYSKVRY